MTRNDYRRFSQAAENNQLPILTLLQRHFAAPGCVLEIGSGSGQHAVRFSRELPHLSWQPTEQQENLPDLNANLAVFAGENVRAALPLCVGEVWPPGSYHYGFAANVLHIIPEDLMTGLFASASCSMISGAVFCLYGPFRYGGLYTSESNARFNDWLQDKYEGGGIRDFERVSEIAADNSFELVADHAMPANNQLLVFRAA